MKTCASGCRRFHNRDDAPMRGAGITAGAREARAVSDLFAHTEAS